MTGLTGYILVLIAVIIVVFSVPAVRRWDFNAFWITHQLWMLMYIFLVAHGASESMTMIACSILAAGRSLSFFLIASSPFPVFYLLSIHSPVIMVQQPIFWQYAIAPVILFTIDKLVTLATSAQDVKVLEAHLLPANVLGLRIQRPVGFRYVSGQWVRIRCPAVASYEWHPFTIR